jgi:hypothetical protein
VFDLLTFFKFRLKMKACRSKELPQIHTLPLRELGFTLWNSDYRWGGISPARLAVADAPSRLLNLTNHLNV